MTGRIRIEAVSALAAVSVAKAAFWLTDRTAEQLIPLPAWRPLFAFGLALPLVLCAIVRLILPVRASALGQPTKGREA